MRGNTERRKADGLPPTETPPPGWEVCPLCELCEPRGEIVDPADADCEVYVGLEHIDSGDPRLRRRGAPGDVRSAKALFHPGDVLFGKLRPYLEKAVLADCYGICSTDIIVLKPLRRRLLPQFLAYVLHTPEFVAYATSTMRGVNHPRTSWQAISEFKVLVPPVEEQRKIAAVLSAVQEAKEKTEAVIDAAKALKRALLKYLFTYGPVPVDQAERVELKETDVGTIPKSWDAKRVGEVGEVVTGRTPVTADPSNYGGRYMFVRPGDMGGSKYVTRTERYLSDKGLSACRALPRGTVLVVCIGATIGKTGLTGDGPCATNQQINAVVAQSDTDSEYLYYALTYRAPALPAKAGRAAVPIVNKSNFESFLIPMCSIAEQRRIAQTLAAVDEKIEAEERRVAALEQLFKTLLRDLMTGRIRVNDLDLEVDV